MEVKSFRVAGLSSCPHTQKTREIFKQHVNGSITEFVTIAIVKYAESLGFTGDTSEFDKPHYIANGRYIEILSMIDKSRKANYTYLVAFEYLRSKRPGVSKSNIQRDAIYNF